ncbi:MAG: molybdate transport system substrate-binding protein, partial [Arcobacteraceae bacterium]
NKINPNTKVNITLGSSGKLTAQILNKAPYQIFLSANMKYPNSLYEKNIATTKPIIYAQGSLALLSQNQRSFKHGLNVLKNISVTRIAIANPKTAPYGKATLQALEKLGILNEIKSKIIYAESISQTVTYTLIAADIGIVAKSSLYSPKMNKFKKNVHWVEVDKTLYTPINQGMVMLKNSEKNKEVLAFYIFMQSKQEKKILEKFGYSLL